MATVIRGDDNFDSANAGKVLQIVSTTSQTSTNGNTSFANITGATVTITPSSTSSKVLVTFSTGGMSNGTSDTISLRILRGSTNIRTITRYGYGASSGWSSCPIVLNFLDSPNTTSATTYQLQLYTQTNNDFRVNDDQATADGIAGLVSTATEIGG